jgi:hypothetical protein
MARGYSHQSGLVPIKQRDPSSLRSVGMTTGGICSVGMTTGGICSIGITTLRLWALGMTTVRIRSVGMTTGRICSGGMTYKHYGTPTLQHSYITTLSHYCTEMAQKINRHKKSGPKAASLHCHKRPYQPVISFRPAPMSAKLRTVLTPASSSAANFSSAVPLPPETIAPAWPIRLPAGAVTPAI